MPPRRQPCRSSGTAASGRGDVPPRTTACHAVRDEGERPACAAHVVRHRKDAGRGELRQEAGGGRQEGRGLRRLGGWRGAGRGGIPVHQKSCEAMPMIPRQDAPTISHASVNDTRPMPAVPAPVGTAAWVNGVPGTRGGGQGLRMRDGRSRSFSGGTWLRGHPSARKRCWTSFSRRFCSMAPGPGTDVAQAGELDGGRTRDEGRQVQGRGGGVVYGRDGFGVGPGGRVLRMRGG